LRYKTRLEITGQLSFDAYELVAVGTDVILTGPEHCKVVDAEDQIQVFRLEDGSAATDQDHGANDQKPRD
jgi:hypothetical protein